MSDGVNYINIYSKGLTPLGRSLSNWADCKITISIGYFRTIEGLIFYLGSFNEKFRYMTGIEAKKWGSMEDRQIRLPEDVFRRFIVEAMWKKVNNDPGLRESLKESTLPFKHYYNINGKKLEVWNWNWQVEEWEKIRKELQMEIY